MPRPGWTALPDPDGLHDFVDGATLQQHLDDPAWCVVDLRHQLADTGYGERAYAAAHIPRAIFLHLDRDLSGPMTGTNGRHPLPDPERLEGAPRCRRHRQRTQVVVYDDAQGMIAGRLWWFVALAGAFPRRLSRWRFSAWQAEGRPVDPVVPSRARQTRFCRYPDPRMAGRCGDPARQPDSRSCA